MEMEIKFRAWDSELKFMVDPSKYLVGFDGKLYFNNGGQLIDQTDKLKFMQFIGQTDKHEKEIFQGDIISNNSSWHQGNTWVIEKKFGCFLMRFVSGVAEPKNGFILSYDFNLDIYEIIGNIYENENLIK